MAHRLFDIGFVWACMACSLGRCRAASISSEGREENSKAGMAESARAAALVPRVQLRFACHCSWADCHSAFGIPQRRTRRFAEGCGVSAMDGRAGLGDWVLLLGMDRRSFRAG